MQSQAGATSSSSSSNSMLTSLHFCSGPAALRALHAGGSSVRARLPASRMPLRCLASKGRKKDAEESERWLAETVWAEVVAQSTLPPTSPSHFSAHRLPPPPCAPAAAGVYSKTVNLPQTAFDMRANSVVREPQLQQFWADNKIYEQLSRGNPGVSRRIAALPPLLDLLLLLLLLLLLA